VLVQELVRQLLALTGRAGDRPASDAACLMLMFARPPALAAVAICLKYGYHNVRIVQLNC
jgi:hypothetical protein